MAEYDQYEAIVDIYYPSFDITGSLAYADGDRVPASNVVLYGYLPLGWVRALATTPGSGFPSLIDGF